METKNSQHSSSKLLGIALAAIFFAVYSLKSKNTIIPVPDDDISVSLCQIQYQFDVSDRFNNQLLLSILVKLKIHDFQIGQPVWGTSDILIYLCEHRLKDGLKKSIIDKELNTVLRNSDELSKRLIWSCA